MKLFLSSAGIKPETKDAFLNLIGKDPEECVVAFIPTACDLEEDKSYVQWTIDQLEELGLKISTIDLKGENERSLYDKLSKVDIICVNGGNTFYLLDWVKTTGFDKIVKKLLDEGKVYLGISAGSYICCPTIEVSTWKNHDNNIINLKDLTGINLVNFLMFVHYEDKYKNVVEDGIKTTSLPLAVLTNQQAIVVDGDNISLAGPKEVLTYNNFKFTG